MSARSFLTSHLHQRTPQLLLANLPVSAEVPLVKESQHTAVICRNLVAQVGNHALETGLRHLPLAMKFSSCAAHHDMSIWSHAVFWFPN